MKPVGSWCLAGVTVAMIGLAVPAGCASAGERQSNLTPVVNGLNKVTRDVCHSLKLTCKKSTSAFTKKAGVRVPKTAHTRKSPNEKTMTASQPLPTPTPKPERRVAPVAATQQPVSMAPIPRKRPTPEATDEPETKVAVVVPEVHREKAKPVAREPELKPVSTNPSDMTALAVTSDCEASLRNSKVQFDAVTAPPGGENCSVENPVRLHSVTTPSGIVSLPESPIFNCRFARQFSLWLSDTGSAIVLAQMNTRLDKVATGPGFVCRHRNGDSSGKMSEHASGDAVDITTMTTADGTTIHMADAINPQSHSYAVLRALRTTACGYFTTVLGPGANEAHKEHYHFDLGVHGKSASYRICE